MPAQQSELVWCHIGEHIRVKGLCIKSGSRFSKRITSESIAERIAYLL